MAESDKIDKFLCTGEQSNVGPRWKRWLTAFELYADSKGLIIEPDKNDHKQRRRALLLHAAGTDVQDIFATLDDTGGPTDYDKAITALNGHFLPKVNTAHGRHVFKHTLPTSGETIQQYLVRLRLAVKDHMWLRRRCK